MKSNLLLLAFAGLAFASTHPGWKDNTEYVYHVSGRTLTSLNELADQYSGIFLTAKLHISPRPDGKLQARISDAMYAQIHSDLSDTWNTYVPESQLSYQQLQLSNKPFHIVTKDGLIKSLIVEKEISNWEANVIKSIVSQLQLDLHGKRAIPSPMNNLPSDEKMDGVFKTMEETVTGETETEYEIHRLPEYLTQTHPWLVPQKKLKGVGEIYEVIKSKNYTNNRDMPAYHYGFGEISEGEPTFNNIEGLVTRHSSSRVILTGTLSKYTVQSAQTVNKIIINPTMISKERGSVISALNLTLSEVKTHNQHQELSRPIEIGCLVYTYETPFASNNEVHQKMQSDVLNVESSEMESSEGHWQRFRRGADQMIRKMQREDSSSSSSEEPMQHQPKPIMTEVPESPLLPYYAGYYGRSIKESKNFDLKQSVKKIANEISEDISQPEKILLQSTLSKYVMLSSLVRVMSEEEIRSVTQDLYNEGSQEEKRLTWVVFRDAVAEAGTGPALLNIEEWISNKKIEKDEAGDIVASMASSVRVPTKEYMQKFFEMVRKTEVMRQEGLNETALLSYTRLLHQVYVDKLMSHNQYPVHSFKAFYTKEGKEFVKSTVVPYLSQQLDHAVAEADSRKIHVYIRALGNVGHRKTVEAFEPYLEGEKQVSQFQRMLMVLSLDKLVVSYPVLARSVLYRIYQNAAEVPEVRVVAVYQLIRTNPPVEMLQRMAENTNTDHQEEVNAAVKSAIEYASELKSSKSESLRKAAESARSLLTKKRYSSLRSMNLLQDFVVRNTNVEFKQNMLQVESSDHMMPKIIKYTLRGNTLGMKHYFVTVQATLSSIKELVNELYKQTETYEESKLKRSQQKSADSKWSSAKIAEALNIETTEKEQLEGLLYTEMESIQKIWSFDNATIHQWPQMVREKEQLLKNGKQFQYTKMRQLKEMALSVPTEMGFPFLYTYDTPILIQFEGRIKAVATPEIARENKLRKPEQVSAQMDGSFTVSTKVQTHLSVVTPFDHQVYTAGFDRNAQIHLPLKAKVEMDVQENRVKFEYEFDEKHRDSRLFHYSSWPYTSRSDILSLSPIALRENTHRITPQANSQKSFDFILGKEQTGMAFRVWGNHPQQAVNLRQFLTLAQTEGIATALQKVWDSSTLQQTEFSLRFAPEKSTSRKFVMDLGSQDQYVRQSQAEQQRDFGSMEIQTDIQKRQQELMELVSAGIKNAWSKSIDVSIEFDGEKKYQHLFTMAYAKSNVAPDSNMVVFYKNNAQHPFELRLQMKAHIPNPNLMYSLNAKPQGLYEMRLQYGQNKADSSKMIATVDMQRSQSRKHYIEEHPMYHMCKKEMQEGNYQLAACRNISIESNYFDDIKVEMKYENMQEIGYSKHIEDAFKAIRVMYYPMTEIRKIQPEGENKINLRVQLEPENLRQVNLTIRSDDEETKMYNVSLDQLSKTILVPHPIFNLKARLAGYFMGQDDIRATCVIDETAAETFSNKTYPLSLGEGWTVMMQYIPQQARPDQERRLRPLEQLRDQQENFVVLVREVSEHHKEVVLSFSSPITEGKTVEIYMKRDQKESNPIILVDNEEVHFDQNNAAEMFNGYVEMYSLPSQEVKVEIQGWFYLIFDGERVVLRATSDKLYDSVIGLCGRFSGDVHEDFWTPNNCIVKSPEMFVESFKIEARKQTQAPEECIRKELPLYADVISNRDVDRRENRMEQNRGMAKLRNRYVESNDEICFTIHPVAECKNQARRTTTKNIPVHCIPNTKTAMYLKKQIDQGGNPDFSHKSETKTIQMDVPRDCN